MEVLNGETPRIRRKELGGERKPSNSKVSYYILRKAITLNIDKSSRLACCIELDSSMNEMIVQIG